MEKEGGPGPQDVIVEAEAKESPGSAQGAEGASELVEYAERKVRQEAEKGQLGTACKGLALSIVLRSMDLTVETLENQHVIP